MVLRFSQRHATGCRGVKPLKQSRPDLLKPIQLFGSPAGWKELKAGGDAKMHKAWSPRIAPCVRAIYQYWLPARLAAYQKATGRPAH